MLDRISPVHAFFKNLRPGSPGGRSGGQDDWASVAGWQLPIMLSLRLEGITVALETMQSLRADAGNDDPCSILAILLSITNIMKESMNINRMFLAMAIFSYSIFGTVAAQTEIDKNWEAHVDSWVNLIKQDPNNIKNFEIIGQQAKQWQDNALGRFAPKPGLESAKWVFGLYCGLLQRAGIENNVDLAGRAGNGDTWACGDHSLKLTQMFNAFGMRTESVLACCNYFEGVNYNHGAIAFIDSSGEMYFFDPWMLAYNSNSFANSGDSEWNGMQAQDWEDYLKANGYKIFSSDSGNSWYDSIKEIPAYNKDALIQGLKGKEVRDKRYAKTNIGGAWYMGGPVNVGGKCSIDQNGNDLVFTNENGQTSRGEFVDSSTIVATDWENGLKGTLSNGGTRIDWANGSWWIKV